FALVIYAPSLRHIGRNPSIITRLKLLTIGVARIGCNRQIFLRQDRLGSLGHRFQLLVIAAVLSDSMMHDQPMLAIHRVLHVISHTSPLMGTHHAGLVLTHDVLLQHLYLHQRLGCQVIGLSAFHLLLRRLDRHPT